MRLLVRSLSVWGTAMCLFSINILVIYGLAVYGGRHHTPDRPNQPSGAVSSPPSDEAP
jgi:hypothetical protein